MLRKEEVASMRIDYKTEGFSEDDLVAKEPMKQFDVWFKMARESKDIQEANAMVLSTCGSDGQPSARTVLMKNYDDQGFTFFTNFTSTKGKQLMENPKACLLFYWPPLHRQVIIKGTAEKVSDEEATEYFHSRPRGSQIGACISRQSTVIPSREVLSEREKVLKERYADESIPVPKPDYWGGFLVRPESIEFWNGQTSRLHNRIRFRKLIPNEEIDSKLTKLGTNGWVYEMLSP
ncbi:pyridoxine-5'-phosphate oxidase-like [Actinia tenebrosa]|uniref:pyridoxal 5'-phosphate synthase n=1 Tax=Actinia tenebrosa TaxID=6105 RepID=A0A6P8IVC3_ACTTE|nr:pyridoxine-5'-phosphate oxidase-like [Actinia tenebrosa]